jgi:hypothetical protein
LGQGALSLAAILGGVMAFPNTASAGNGNCYCCPSGNHRSSYLSCMRPPSPIFCVFRYTGCHNCHGPC